MIRKLIIDTDPGIDDAVALAIALFSKKVEVKLITTVNGNVSLDKVTKNILKLLPYFEKKVPVAKGISRPFVKSPIDASGVHGKTGMDGFDFPEEDNSLLLENDAIEEMKNLLVSSDEKITIMAIGPLTNIAMLIRKYPEVTDKIEEIVLMGGSISRGNSGVYSEFNIDCDPEAADIVFKSSIPKVMVTLDVGLKALVYPEDSEKIKDMNKIGYMFYNLFKTYRGGSFSTGLKMYDSCAIAYILNPDMFETVNTFVGVELDGKYTKGATVVDLKGYLKKENNAKVTVDIDKDIFKKWFLNEINNCK